MGSNDNVFRVSVKSDSKKLAVAVMSRIQDKTMFGKDEDFPVLSCLGAGAINQGVKALSILRGLGAQVGKEIWFYPYFEVKQLDDGERTFINFKIMVK